MNTVAIKKCIGGYLLVNEQKLGEPHVFTTFAALAAKAQELLDGPEVEKPKGQLSIDEINKLLEGNDGLYGI